jgi:hypothetical protein
VQHFATSSRPSVTRTAGRQGEFTRFGWWRASCNLHVTMNTLHTLVSVSLASAGMLVLGCEHTDRSVATSSPSEQPIGATNAQPAGNTVDASVVDRLANARCDREQTCDNVGDGKTYASRHVCLEQQKGSIANDLNSYQCPRGIDGAAVQQCLSAIGGEECGAHPVEAITRMDRCRNGAMCMK